jgi:hypothetical protein
MNFFEEQPLPIVEMAPAVLRYRTRRDLLLFSAGAVAVLNSRGKEWLLNKALRIDDDVAEALYSRNRRVSTYTKSQITPLKNNCNGATAYPPVSQAKWALVESSVNLNDSGNPDPYFVSIDLATARHPQTLLATHFNGQPLPVEHGAPLRLLAPVKLGSKSVKAITRITYTAEEPKDYWSRYGYSPYNGL